MTVAAVAKEVKNLSKRMEKRLEQVDQRFGQIDQRFEQIDQRFEQIDQRFEQIDQRFEQIDQRFEQIDQRFEQIDQRFEQIDRRFGTLTAEIDEKLDGFAVRIEGRVRVLLDGMRNDFKVWVDRTFANTERLERFEREHAEEHRLLQAQIDDLDAKLQSRRPSRRRPS